MSSFLTIRSRLLRSYLFVLAAVLSVFAIGVRVVFTRNLTHQLSDRLISLGQTVASASEFEKGKFTIGEGVSTQRLINRDQMLQWFDPQGRLVTQNGKIPLSLPFSSSERIKLQQGNPRIQSVTLPILESDNRKLIGYVRVSQTLEEVDETLLKLDLGLGGGIVVALLCSAIGGVWLTRQAMQPIEESFDRLKQFTADASHELRSPLMAVKSNAAVALKYPEGIREKDAEKFDAIASATNQMIQLTEDLLLLARSDQLPNQQRERIDLTAMLDNLVQLQTPQAQAKQIDLKAQLMPGMRVLGDESQLWRVFMNLIANALNYTPADGQITIVGRRVGQSLMISVQDTGIGIAPEHLARVFDRLWRADQARSRWAGGSGLGLSIAQAIVQNHQGEITVTSQLNIGSRFTVRLPSA
jgi:OmpR-family two-component system manganese-sensing sensor histidine kinase